MKNIILTIFATLLLASCSTAVHFTSERYSRYEDMNNSQVVNIMYGKASYYGDEFNGRATASGEIFDNREFTAAHKSLPFGTFVRVTNLSNNSSVVVKINDRGPFVSGRIIDLTKAAAEKLGMLQAGVIDVKIEILR